MMQRLFAPHISCRGTLGGNHRTIFGTQLAVRASARHTHAMHCMRTELCWQMHRYLLCNRSVYIWYIVHSKPSQSSRSRRMRGDSQVKARTYTPEWMSLGTHFGWLRFSFSLDFGHLSELYFLFSFCLWYICVGWCWQCTHPRSCKHEIDMFPCDLS